MTYADDLVILRQKGKAEEALQRLHEIMGKLKLTVYRRSPDDPYPTWTEENCPETNNHVTIANEDYMLSAEGFLMPTRKDQAPPNLRYFKQSQK